MGWVVPRPAPLYNPRMSLAGAHRLMGYQPKRDKKRDARLIQAWILDTSVEELAAHIMRGVNLDKPPPELFVPRPSPPQGQGGLGGNSARHLGALTKHVDGVLKQRARGDHTDLRDAANNLLKALEKAPPPLPPPDPEHTTLLDR